MKKTVLIMALLTTGLSVAHAGDATQKNANDNLMASGQWQDPKTGLIWMRCSVGQKWTGSSCSGDALKFNWQQAKDYVPLFNEQVAFAGEHTWRLPTITELVTIRQCSNGWMKDTNEIPDERGGNITVPFDCEKGSNRPTIDARMFPNTPVDFYWSSSPDADYANLAWGVSFHYGNASFNHKDDRFRVRLVRTQ